ncbi:hypothetical protein PBY51_014765 [Eleginops maclovinus]|uniref:Uncharacterized protein n=1 Tax=Eleginops maclovinus TaxID=56733 RepID=A0AAN7X308_ELEMC|nr:hypothetical protein PBY51_014765 [Eleginops maclovinus]
MAAAGGTQGGGGSSNVSVLVSVVVVAAVTVVVALQFPVFNLSFSLSLLRCLRPPPPSRRPPARLSPPPPPFHGESISPAVGRYDGTREWDVVSFLQAGQRGGDPGCVCCWLRGEADSSGCAAAADADAAVRETEPSMGPQPLKRVHFSCGGSAQLSFENGGLHSPFRCALTPTYSTLRK